MKKLIMLILALAIVLSGCSVAGETDNASIDPIKIGVIQLVRHNALDDAYSGFVKGLEDAGYEIGKDIIIDLQNAQGDVSNTNTIASKLVNDGNDIILAIATPAAQAVANATSEIPLLFTCVTDPVEAGLVASFDTPGGNITGTSDEAPIDKQIGLIVDFMPEVKTIGMLYCSNEANSHVQAKIAKEATESRGIEFKEFTVSESNQIQQVVTTAVGQVDAIYTCTDNMIAAAMIQISGIAKENNVPIFTGERGQVENGAVATYGIDYFLLGKMTAEQAVKIIGGAETSTMPVLKQQEFELILNEESIAAFGLEIPENLK